MEIKVMTFNLRVNVASDKENAWPNRVQAAADTIKRSGAWLVGTQEGLHGMLLDLQEKLPDYAWVGAGRRGGSKDEYCAVFYKKADLELMESGQFWLSETPSKTGSVSWDSSLPRICTWAKFRCVSQPDKEITIYNTHLDHRGQQARENGTRLIWDTILRSHGDQPSRVVITGDFNAEPDNPAVQYLRGLHKSGGGPVLADAFGAEAFSEEGCTFHGFSGQTEGWPIDYIFATRDLTFLKTTVDRQSSNGRYPSDHYPVLSKILVP